MSEHTPHCTYTRWQIIDKEDNKDYRCDMTGKLCYGELRCKYYKPDMSEHDPSKAEPVGNADKLGKERE